MDKNVVMDKYKFGEYIYNKRKELRLTQEELGKLLGVTNKAVSKWEVGETLPDITMLQPLSSALGVTIDELLSYTDKEKDDKKVRKINLFLLITSCILFISTLVLIIVLITIPKKVNDTYQFVTVTSDNILDIIDINPLDDIVCDEETLIVSSNYKLKDGYTFSDNTVVSFTIVYQYNYYYYLKDETMGLVTYYNRFHEVSLSSSNIEETISILLEPKMDINNFKGFNKIKIDYIVINCSGEVKYLKNN